MTLLMDISSQIKDGQAQLRFPHMSTQEFIEFCLRNRDLNIERTSEGDVIVMPPADSWGDSRNAELVADLILWNRQLIDPSVVFGPSACFVLPNGAVRSPDASWISRVHWQALTDEERSGFAQICPEFVVEILSPSDSLRRTQEKMDEYLANGTSLGWLIDRKNRTVYIYRSDSPTDVRINPTTLNGDPELPGFTLDTSHVF